VPPGQQCHRVVAVSGANLPCQSSHCKFGQVASPHDMSRSPGADTATLTIICVLAGSRDLQHRVVATLYENPLQLCTLEEIIVELFGFGAKSTFKLMWRGSDDVSIDMETDTDMAKAISCALVVFRGVLQIEVHPDEPFVSNSMNLEDTSVVEAARVHFLQLSAGQLVITGLQMQTLCTRIGISLNDQKCKSMLKRLDPQNQDAIRWTDFENWLQKRHTKKRMKPAAKSKGKGLKINTVRSPESVASQLS